LTTDRRTLISLAKQAALAADAPQAVLVLFDGEGGYATASYGRNRMLCDDVRQTCEAVGRQLEQGSLPAPPARSRS